MPRRRVAHCLISWCWVEDMAVSPVAPAPAVGSGSICTGLSVGPWCGRWWGGSLRCSGKFERRLLVNRGWMAGARNLDAVIGEEALGELAQLVLAKVAAFYQVLAWVAHSSICSSLTPERRRRSGRCPRWRSGRTLAQARADRRGVSGRCIAHARPATSRVRRTPPCCRRVAGHRCLRRRVG